MFDFLDFVLRPELQPTAMLVEEELNPAGEIDKLYLFEYFNEKGSIIRIRLQSAGKEDDGAERFDTLINYADHGDCCDPFTMSMLIAVCTKRAIEDHLRKHPQDVFSGMTSEDKATFMKRYC